MIENRRPPYNEIELEYMARSLVSKTAYGCFASSRDAQQSFIEFFKRMGGPGMLSALKDGMIYLVGFLPKGRKVLPNDIPKFYDAHWLDLQCARRVLMRALDLEVVAGDLGAASSEVRKQTEEWLKTYEQGRIESIPQVEQMIREAGK